MSYSLYDLLRDRIQEMSQTINKEQANEELITVIDDLMYYLNVSFPGSSDLVDSIIAEWRKKQL